MESDERDINVINNVMYRILSVRQRAENNSKVNTKNTNNINRTSTKNEEEKTIIYPFTEPK